ncbi:type II toxin-antitoxin system VapC family toxin [Lyngbya confervoides]|uniref:type II toxin-antitoxin system VapC family toxin n=1 Tax=Lyngbya confervoides TaxID=207921 RepID=UPI00140C3C68|nr:type II toxin-antitoxin system VapC family toxin [Lyngbya confervoides]
MRLLLDTHALIWWISSSEQLPQQVLDLLEDSDNPLFLSVASIWEIQIKCQNGKLELGKPLAQLISNQQANNGLAILLIEPAHVYALQGLPDVHRDPFDRIMIAQAIMENLAFVSADRVLSGYPVRQVW